MSYHFCGDLRDIQIILTEVDRIYAAANFVHLRELSAVSGMDGLQSSMERIRVRRREGPSNYAEQALEARHSHVQQVTRACRICIVNLAPHDKSIGESNYPAGKVKIPMNFLFVKNIPPALSAKHAGKFNRRTGATLVSLNFFFTIRRDVRDENETETRVKKESKENENEKKK